MMAVVMVSLWRLPKKGPDSTLRRTNRVLWAAADYNGGQTFGFPVYGCSRPRLCENGFERSGREFCAKLRISGARFWQARSTNGRSGEEYSAGIPASSAGGVAATFSEFRTWLDSRSQPSASVWNRATIGDDLAQAIIGVKGHVSDIVETGRLALKLLLGLDASLWGIVVLSLVVSLSAS
jgi:hypothetical protein